MSGEKKEVSLTLLYFTQFLMPALKLKALKAQKQNRDVCSRFTYTVVDKFLEIDNVALTSLIGEDELNEVDAEDQFAEDLLTDDDAAIMNDLDDSDKILSTDDILEHWRNSVSRQENDFVRRGESKRSKRLHKQTVRELQEAALTSKKITSFFESNGFTSSSSLPRNALDEVSMEDLMRGTVIEEVAFAEREEDLQSALKKLEMDSNFCIPLSAKADKKLSEVPKYEFMQRLSIKSYLNFRVNHGLGKMEASIAVAAAMFITSHR